MLNSSETKESKALVFKVTPSHKLALDGTKRKTKLNAGKAKTK